MEPPPLPKTRAKPPLITPSASPPPPLRGTLSRRTESVPPMKRRRTTSTPRPPTPASSQDPVDLEEQRKASTMRLLDFWDNLARYTRPLDEDDLVDILTGEVTRDVGVLRSSNKFEFGSMAAPVVDDVTSEDELQENDYDDVDELDAFQDDVPDAEDSDADASCDLDMGANIVPLVAPLGPADADDLREFMEAEKARREMYGAEEDDDEEYNHAAREHDEGHDTLEYSSDVPGTSQVNDEREEGEDGEEQEDLEHDERQPSVAYEDYVIPTDGDSDDELDDWAPNSSSVIHPVAKQDTPVVEAEDDSDSDIEIISMTRPTGKSHANAKTNRGASSKPQSHSERRQGTLLQLNTPPQSSSSVGPSENNTDAGVSTKLPTPRSSSTSRSLHLHSPKEVSTRGPENITSRIPKPLPVVEVRNHIQEVPERRIDLSTIRKSTSPLKLTPRKPKMASSSPSKSTVWTPNNKPFVLLTPRKPSVSPTKSVATPWPDRGSSLVPSSTASKGKGKEKQDQGSKQIRRPLAENKVQRSPSKRNSVQPVPLPFENENNTSFPSFSSPSKPSQSYSSKPTDEETFFSDSRYTPEESISNNMVQNTTFPSPPVFRKRKRTSEDVPMESPEPKVKEIRHSTGREPVPSKRHSSTSRLSDDEAPKKPSPAKARSSSRIRQRTPEWESDSESDEFNSSGSTPHGQRQSRPPTNADAHSFYRYPSHYSAAHHSPPLQGYPPTSDVRAQMIIAQAMQQLSALASVPWIPSHQYRDTYIPQTPSHHRSSSRLPMTSPFQTPTHPHPYPYSYDPNSSHATLPPDSPDVSSPEKSSPVRRKSLVRRSRSRGRRVSFHLQEEGIISVHDVEPSYSSPSDRHIPSSRPNSRQGRNEDRTQKSKGKGRAHTPYHGNLDSEKDDYSDIDERDHRSRTRGQTPGPIFELPRTPAQHDHYGSSSDSPKKQGSRRKHRDN